MHDYMLTLNPADYFSTISWPRPPSYKFSDLSTYLFGVARHSQTTIHALPPELLEHIFSYYTHVDDEDIPGIASGIISTHCISARPRAYANPLILGHVCSRWMSISRNQQRLWTKLYVTEPESAKQVAMARYWLSLSGTSPLTLSLKISSALAMSHAPSSAEGKNREKSRAEAVRRYVDLFLMRYDQWQSITIKLSGTTYLPSLLNCGPNSIIYVPKDAPPMLKHVDIDYGSWMLGDRRRPNDAMLSVLYSAPGLDSVSWSAQWYAPTKLVTHEVFPHWKNLRKLVYRQGYSYNTLKVADAIALLDACPLLEHFDALFYPEHGHGGTHEVQELVKHRNLRVLDLTIMQSTAAVLFDSLDLPALEEVKIEFPSDYGNTVNSAFVGLLKRSECKLQRVFFDNSNGGTDSEVILEVLRSQHLKDLKVLQLAGVRTSGVMRLLTRRAAVEETLAVLPLLERLDFQKFAYGDSPSIDDVENMIMSRTKQIRGLGVGRLKKEGHGDALTTLARVELQLGELGTWDYYRLAKLGSRGSKIVLTDMGTRSEMSVPPIMQVLSGVRNWIMPGARFAWDH
ncbi:hypothetical protein JR316_0012245 [Psilocybe cubensis]|uniref:F-box domain-containing protein n=2 Tax=Psilocybe cubensis TaxID=181762 RepID=A0A8H7XPA2_PSICU|nr:hypothetical protein JR316_0012245 [Psilocybe cubensis]KAH9475134.1 hypothetical protein JR316_0012245 [Psilocybe cubensis]